MNQFTLLDTYVAASAAGWDFSFGKQSLWWGPGDGGALIFSSNAEPIYMFRGSRVAPVGVPLVSRLLGPMKVDFFVGKLSGNEFPARPLMHGEKLSFKPTANLEFGFSRTVEFGGVGRPMTAGAIWNSYACVKSSTNYGATRNTGKRSSGVVFYYKVPFVRNWLTVYVDSFAADDVTPLANPPRAAWISACERYKPGWMNFARNSRNSAASPAWSHRRTMPMARPPIHPSGSFLFSVWAMPTCTGVPKSRRRYSNR